LQEPILLGHYQFAFLDYLITKIEQAILDFGITNLDNNLPFYVIIKYKRLI